ncbi:MAG: alcohol dehydrogenase catalytic domain-containing protein [Rhodospirillales bacterium]|nr:alcohol dehydrogenase catalytic domain-containing protein [Rhodospirillales bacterium]
MTSPGEIVFEEVATPEPASGEVLVQMMRIGVCGSDVHVYYGKHPFTSYPVVQGHEVSGRIMALGDNVDGLEEGDKITIQPQVVCGECLQCRTGKYHICDDLKVMGFQATGTASDYFTVAAERVLKLPATMSFEHGAMVEPVAVGVHALKQGGDIEGKKAIVLGAGPIGILTAQAAKGMGASQVMITDFSDYRLQVAEQCGIDFCVDVGSQDLSAEIHTAFGPDKADLILECVGTDATMDQAVTNARKGTTIVVVGVFEEEASVNMGLVQDRELSLVGTLMYQRSDYEMAIEMIEAGAVRLDPLISGHFDFTNYKNAYLHIENNKEKSLKVFIKGRES